MKIFKFRTCIQILMLLIFCQETLAQTIYVSPTAGSDTNPGSISAPFKTVKKAFEQVASDGSIKEVSLRGGIYNFSETIVLDNTHSGELNSPLIVRAYQDEEVVFTSNTAIPVNSFKKLETMSAEVINRLPAISQSEVYVTSLAGNNFFQNPGEGNYGLISWDGYSLPVAQWPNKGFGYMQTVTDVGPFTRFLAPGELPPSYSFSNPSGGKFIMENSCAMDLNLLNEDLQNSEDIALQGYFHNDWYYDRNFLARVDVNTREMQLLRHTLYGVEDNHAFPRRFKLLNAISQLDMPGEWYYDKKEQLFFIWPVQTINQEKPLVRVNNISLFKSNGVSHINFEKINFSGFGDAAIEFHDSQYISVKGCSFSSSQNGRGVNFQRSMHNTINGCDFFDLFNAFTFTGRSENRSNLVQEHNVATNNHIYNCYIRGYGLTSMSGVGGYYANNLIHDVNGGITFDGNDHVMEYNEFYNSGFGMGDWNAVYFGGSISHFGNKVQNNFFHHFPETPGTHPITAIRGDDGASGIAMLNNIFYKTGRGGADGSGPDIHVEGNVCINSAYVWSHHQRPADSRTREQYLADQVADHERMQQEIANGTLNPNEKNNYLGRAEKIFGNEGWINNTAWINKYPNFSKVFDLTDPHSHPWTQSYSKIVNNYISGGSALGIYSHGSNPNGSIVLMDAALPNTAQLEAPVVLNLNDAFENPTALDFRFKSSFVPMSGFEKWDFDRVGLVVDADRSTTPNKNEYRNKVYTKYDGISSSGGSVNLAEVNLRYPDPAYFEVLTLSKNTIPGLIEAEDYDEGCNGVAFYDTDGTNKGLQYRSNAVDIENTTDTNSDYMVGFIKDGEWLNYTVNIEEADEYRLEARISSPVATGRFIVEFNGVDKTGSIVVPNTGSFNNWQTIGELVALEEGVQVMRVNIEKGDFNLNWIKLTKKSEVSDKTYTIKANGETCIDKDNGKINVKAYQPGDYTLSFGGSDIDFSEEWTVENLVPGDYDFCVTDNTSNLTNCFGINVADGIAVTGKTSSGSKKMAIEISEGTAPFNVFVNGEAVLQTSSRSFSVDANYGDSIEVKTSIDCEGTLTKMMSGIVNVSPNPTAGDFGLTLPMPLKEVTINLYNVYSQLVSAKTYPVVNGKVALDLNDNPSGIYFVTVQLEKEAKVVKIIKK